MSKCIFEDETVLEENPHPKSGLRKFYMGNLGKRGLGPLSKCSDAHGNTAC